MPGVWALGKLAVARACTAFMMLAALVAAPAPVIAQNTQQGCNISINGAVNGNVANHCYKPGEPQTPGSNGPAIFGNGTVIIYNNNYASTSGAYARPTSPPASYDGAQGTRQIGSYEAYFGQPHASDVNAARRWCPDGDVIVGTRDKQSGRRLDVPFCAPKTAQ